MYLLEWKEAKNTETLNEEEENKTKTKPTTLYLRYCCGHYQLPFKLLW